MTCRKLGGGIWVGVWGMVGVLASGCATRETAQEPAGDARPSAPLQVTAEKVRPKTQAAKRSATELLDGKAEAPVALAMQDESTGGDSSAVNRAARGLEQLLQGAGRDEPVVMEAPVARPASQAPVRPRLRPSPIELPALPPVPVLAEELDVRQGVQPTRQPAANVQSVATGQTASAVFAPVTSPRLAQVVEIPEVARPAVAARVTPSLVSQSGDPVLKIRHFAAASRVESFGRYTPMDLQQVPAGQAIAMLLYTELDGFAHRSPAGLPPPPEGFESENDRGQTEWIVKVSQEVAVYGPGDVLVRAVPSQVAKDVSKRRRRDHYLVQRLDLPRTLAAGEYRIKVSVKDEATGQVAEAIVPMTIARGVVAR
jgi:hypothetical protein